MVWQCAQKEAAPLVKVTKRNYLMAHLVRGSEQAGGSLRDPDDFTVDEQLLPFLLIMLISMEQLI